MSYPTNIDAPATPGAKLSSNPHSTLHSATNTSIVAIETKLGVDSSAVATSIDYLLKNTSSIDPGHKHSTSSLSDFLITSVASGDVLQYNGTKYVNKSGLLKFGGTGADGALTITSGTTTIDLGAAQVFIKNYTSISITNTGALAFSNPHANGTVIILKSQGNVALTSSATPLLSGAGMGAAGGSANSSNATGNTGTSGSIAFGTAPTGGVGGGGGGGTTGGAAGTIASPIPSTVYLYRNFQFAAGAGGGSGGANSIGTASGPGGRGGAVLIVECAGAWNFTTASGISVAGSNGGASTNNGAGPGPGGGGGGGGGMFYAFYNTLTASSGTVVATGGSGSAGGTGTSGNGAGAGGSGASATSGGAVGGNGSGTTGGTGGLGATGISVIAKNTEFS